MMLQGDLRQEQTIGDTAVSGLLNGLIAGAVMGIYLVVAALLTGRQVGEVLSWFTPDQGGDALQGIFLHLAISGIYGIGFGMIRRLFFQRIPGWLVGLAYALVLLTLAELVILPGANLGLGGFSKLHLGAAHLLYGLSLGLLSR